MKATFILGAATTGKSRAATILAKGEIIHRINGRSFRSMSKAKAVDYIVHAFGWNVAYNTTLILVDDFPVKHLHFLFEFLKNETTLAEFRGSEPMAISPKIMVVCEGNYNLSHTTQWQTDGHIFYTCIENKDHKIVMELHHSIFDDYVYMAKSSYR